MPQDPSGADPSEKIDTSFDGLSQDAINSSLQAYTDAAASYNSAGQQYDAALRAQTDAQGTSSQVGADSALQNATSQLDNARSALGAASRSHADLLTKFAVAAQGKVRAAADPAQANLWKDQADKAQSQSDLYKSEADMYQAKTDAAIQTAAQDAQANLSRASSVAARVSSQNDQAEASAALSNARAAVLPALTSSTIQVHQGQIYLAAGRTTQALANAARSQAQADVLIPAQAQDLVAKGILTQAQAAQLQQIGPVKIDDLQAKIGLNAAKVDAIRANIGKSQVLPYADSNAPKLDTFNPITGTVTGVDNPAYKNQYLQPLQDRAAAIDAIKTDLAAGKFGTGQAAVDYANKLVDGISQAAQAQAQGYTPQQYQQTIQQQATAGQNALGAVQTQGNTMASKLLDAASHSFSTGGAKVTPYEDAIGMAGGQGALQQAFSLVQQLKPITSPADVMQHIQAWGSVKQAAQQAMQQPSGTPSQAADQAAQSPVAANMASQAQYPVNTAAQNPNQFGSGGNGQNPASSALLQAAMAAGLGRQ